VAGIGLGATGGTFPATIDNTLLEGNGIGIATSPAHNIVVSRSVISGNATNGAQVDGGQITISDSTIASNNNGLAVSAGIVRLYNNDITFNTSNAITGATTSFGLNRITAPAGTAPTAAGGGTAALGTQ
jgi:hypothetical protein